MTGKLLCDSFTVKDSERKGNFYFVRQFNPILYDKLVSAEGQAIINLDDAGSKLRKALEDFQEQTLLENLTPELYRDGADKFMQKKWKKTYDYELFFGKHPEIGVSKELFSRVRNGTNTFAHDPDINGKSSLQPQTYETLLGALVSMQALLFEYYKKKRPECLDFHRSLIYDPNRQPIGRYWVYSIIETLDSTVCERQVLCHHQDSQDSNLIHYRLLRQYRAADTTEGALRDEKVLRNLWHYCGLQEPRNIVRYSKLNVIYKGEAKETEEKAILYYDFGSNRPHPLHTKMVNTLSTEQKHMIIYDIANGVKELHQAHIFHRNLQPNSVFVFFDPINSFVAAKLVGFEYAKIFGDNATVFKNVLNLYENPSAFFQMQC